MSDSELFRRGTSVSVQIGEPLTYEVRWEDLPKYIRDWFIVVCSIVVCSPDARSAEGK